jgi:hypothetical protein
MLREKRGLKEDRALVIVEENVTIILQVIGHGIK